MRKLTGISLSPGKTLAPPFRYERDSLPIPEYSVSAPEADKEISHLKRALEQASADLSQIRELIRDYLDDKAAAIIDGQILVLKDDTILTEVERKIRENGLNAPRAFDDVLRHFQELIAGSKQDYLRERSVDLRDVRRRVLSYLLIFEKAPVVYYFKKPKIIIAESLLPSDFMLFNPEKIAGIVTREGGITSHVAILAREFGIPYLSNVRIEEIPDSNAEIALDTENSSLFVELGAEDHEKIRQDFTESGKAGFSSLDIGPHQTTPVKVLINLGFVSELKAVKNLSIEGVGLFRTEFLCLEQNRIPDEEGQFEIYSCIVKSFSAVPVVFRTFDFGLDKFLNLVDLHLQTIKGEERIKGGLKMMLSHPDVFMTQIKALLRSAEYGEIRIMLPMVRDPEEVQDAKKLILCAASRLSKRSGIPLIGAMIETKEAVDNLNEILDQVDFISVGTNDLLRYLYGINREKSLARDYLSPQFLKIVSEIIRSANEKGKDTSICGEAAADPLAIPLFTGMEVNALSVNPAAYVRVKRVLNTFKPDAAAALLEKVLRLNNVSEVERILRKEFKGVLSDEQ